MIPGSAVGFFRLDVRIACLRTWVICPPAKELFTRLVLIGTSAGRPRLITLAVVVSHDRDDNIFLTSGSDKGVNSSSVLYQEN